ncbi:hypothetical protein [Pelagicoccus sp. SDUM812002]|uniref:hypothetical protein n=1 Tax=Pelagicoccus sp. SDUM812002 TaxID=3041266 RepID=UPI00280E750C|nr:hypothetical protein [Pelagicoccus sp. SDUM812002]MDQ8188204.1 hypothetical protein [Pelagicoccus sp. SDUM812002]
MQPQPSLRRLPQLPNPETGMSWRSLNQFRAGDRGADFYLACLQYGQHLWLQGLPARAILCLDRAWGADLSGDEPVLQDWPLPYVALVSLLQQAPQDAFLGNPRVHFQHYADRVGEPRRDQRKWRSWACWALSKATLPELPGDPKHAVEEPTLELIEKALSKHGHQGEVDLWKDAFPGKP